MLSSLVSWLVATIGHLGYGGILALMFLESSFFPFPSEVVVPPAGYLASLGEMNLYLVIAAGIGGSILGALFNYWLSVKVGRPFFERYGKYLLVSSKTLDKAEVFFDRHGHISTLIGRLLPGIRQYISLPAGVARMRMIPFITFTAIGSGIWVVILAMVGYLIGNNRTLLHMYLHRITLLLVIACFVAAAIYVAAIRQKRKKDPAKTSKRNYP